MIQDIIYSVGRVTEKGYFPLGTCAVIKHSTTFFVTASHVTGGREEGLVIRLNTTYNSQGYQDTTDTMNRLIDVKIIAMDPLRDVCILAPVERGPVTSMLKLGSTDTLKIGDELVVLGFPHSDASRTVLTQQSCTVGAKILLNSGGIKSKHVVLNIQARPGQSGGPVIRISDGTIVAILIGAYAPSGATGLISLGGIDPQTLHQTTHAVSAEYLERMLKNV